MVGCAWVFVCLGVYAVLFVCWFVGLCVGRVGMLVGNLFICLFVLLFAEIYRVCVLV